MIPQQVHQSDVKPFEYHTGDRFSLYMGDSLSVLKTMEDESVDCIVTSPPYYGQRDYGVEGQIGLESTPHEYIERLVDTFNEAKRILKPSGSLWVNLGDTYWSGKGKPQGSDAKQKNRRFDRPQDKSGPKPLCVPKQLLLIPHRFAIAMQDRGWVVRGDNVWFKPDPMPDPVKDRCALVHEYMFHFVKSRRYYFDYDAVSVPSRGKNKRKAPASVWKILTRSPKSKRHVAVFPEELIKLPIDATCPIGGVFLDPFCGSGTALQYTLRAHKSSFAIGIDISESALKESVTHLS